MFPPVTGDLNSKKSVRVCSIPRKSAVLEERVLKIRAHTFSKAFSFSFTVVCILGILDFSGLLTLPSRTVIEIIFLTMGLSAFFLSWHYNRQGDIDAG
jgi:hypothetical protein